jgi:5-methylcytosine-specific restriction endonuclease McrA
MPGGWVEQRSLPKGANGRTLCRWCNLEVPKGRVTFCSAWCVEEWRLRSDPGYLREKVLERDHGICAGCGLDCLHAERELKRLRRAARLKALLAWGLRAGSRKSLWDAHHIVPVVEGGGECDLDNIRTLCLKCHRAATAELRVRRSNASANAAKASCNDVNAPRAEAGASSNA